MYYLILPILTVVFMVLPIVSKLEDEAGMVFLFIISWTSPWDVGVATKHLPIGSSDQSHSVSLVIRFIVESLSCESITAASENQLKFQWWVLEQVKEPDLSISISQNVWCQMIWLFALGQLKSLGLFALVLLSFALSLSRRFLFILGIIDA